MLTFRPRSLDSIPVSFAGVTPDAMVAKTTSQIERVLLWQGNRQLPLAELFDISGDPSDEVWQLEGDFSSVHHLAAGMKRGELQLAGSAGRHAGESMTGGKLVIQGDAGDYLGAEMRGGRIEVTGSAGDHAGAALVGSKVGMRGGEILIGGSAGTHAAAGMRRGWVTIVGDCGPWAGYRMRAGSLFVFGHCGPRPGAGMRRGTIALLGPAPTLLPTFAYACQLCPQVIHLMLRELAAQGVEQATGQSGDMALHNGDLLEGGRGELFLAQPVR